MVRHTLGLLVCCALMVCVASGCALTSNGSSCMEAQGVPCSVLSGGEVSPNNQMELPTGSSASTVPGWVLVIHGGSWTAVGPAAVAGAAPFAAFLRRDHWATDSIDYRAGARALADVLASYDALRAQVGVSAPICVMGLSAGGHLALMLASYRPAIKCVITEGAPTDLAGLAHQSAYPIPGYRGTAGPAALYEKAVVPNFGSSKSGLSWWSPVTHAQHITARLLMGTSSEDPLIPSEQMREMQQARPQRTTIMLLPGAPTPKNATMNFTHADVTFSALTAWERAETDLLSEIAPR